MINASVYSVKCGKLMQEISMMYVCEDPNHCTPAVPWGGSYKYDLAWGASAELTGYCCYVDGTTCFDQPMECTVNGQKMPCNCVETKFHILADTCPSEDVIGLGELGVGYAFP